jgi:hypothetical protein
MESSKKGLIVMDIDDTMMGGRPAVIRPYMRDFLCRISKEYDLAIWTAGWHSRVTRFLTVLNLPIEWKLILDIDACLCESCYYGIKDLRTVCELLSISPEKVILIDDEPEQNAFNTSLGFRVIQPPAFDANHPQEDHFFRDLLL